MVHDHCRSGMLSLDMAVVLLPTLSGMLSNRFDPYVTHTHTSECLSVRFLFTCFCSIRCSFIEPFVCVYVCACVLVIRYITAALNGITMLMRSFGSLIISTRGVAQMGGRTVDISLEERCVTFVLRKVRLLVGCALCVVFCLCCCDKRPGHGPFIGSRG